jgi:Protein of unknown function (DUF1559)
LAVANYHDAHERYPPPYLADEQGQPAHSWRMLVLPYIEQDHLHKRYDFAKPWDGPDNRALAPEMPRTYMFYSDHRPGLTTANYLAVVGPETAWPPAGKLTSKDVKDGLSSTILIVENRGAGVHWMEPRDLSLATMSFKLNDPAGVGSKYLDPAVAMLDGSLHRLHKDLSPETLRALLTANGGEKIGEADGKWSVLPDGRQRDEKEP